MKKQKLLMLSGVIAVMFLTVAAAGAGIISYTPITGDEDSGISSDIIYTHAIDFGNGDAATVNGVVFASKSGSGDFPAIGVSSQTVGTGNSSIPNGHGGDGGADSFLTEGGMRLLVRDFNYNDSTAEIKLTGLTPGQTYRLRLYNRAWGVGADRSQDVGFDTDGTGSDISGAEDTGVFNPDDASDPDPSLDVAGRVFSLDYEYTLAPGVTTLIAYINQTGGGTYHIYGLTNEEVDTGGPEIVYPKMGEVVDPYPASVTLEWINMDPNGADEVYVDVWFGTEVSDDPNNPGDFEKVVSGQPVSSHTITPGGPGIYYWQVNSYLHGDPASTSYGEPGEPNVVEGRVYMFTNDGQIASVDAGPDMITWSGEPVGLVADVNDDGGSALTYLWSTDTLPGGVTAEFVPGADDPNPTVTFIKDRSVIPIVNAGFEDPVLADDDWNWSLGNQGWGYVDNDGYQGSWNPAATDFAGGTPEGENVGWANPGGVGVPGGLAQVLGDTLIANTTYTLTVEVGNSPWYPYNGYKVQLLAGGTPHNVNSTGYASAVTGGTVIAEDDNSIPVASGTFETVTVVYNYNEVEDANKVGLPLQVRLLAKGNIAADDETEVDFDNVRLTADPTPPPSSIPTVVTVKLTVNDETNPAVTDSMTIDVYDNACIATRIGANEGVNPPADFNSDCKVNIEDLVMIAVNWLNDSSATMTSVAK